MRSTAAWALRRCCKASRSRTHSGRIVASYVIAIVIFAFIFDFSNGFHDSANSIATIVGTRVLSPFAAVVWAAVFNFAAAFTGSLAVAKSIGGGMIEQSVVNPNVIFAGLLGAIVWNVI